MRPDIHALPSRRKIRCVQSSDSPMLAATGATHGIHVQQAQAAVTPLAAFSNYQPNATIVQALLVQPRRPGPHITR
jgi:hypothetical protein